MTNSKSTGRFSRHKAVGAGGVTQLPGVTTYRKYLYKKNYSVWLIRDILFSTLNIRNKHFIHNCHVLLELNFNRSPVFLDYGWNLCFNWPVAD
jgi:hypothetical protein